MGQLVSDFDVQQRQSQPLSFILSSDYILNGERMFTYNISVRKDVENKAIPEEAAGIG